MMSFIFLQTEGLLYCMFASNKLSLLLPENVFILSLSKIALLDEKLLINRFFFFILPWHLMYLSSLVSDENVVSNASYFALCNMSNFSCFNIFSLPSAMKNYNTLLCVFSAFLLMVC